jgi:hypothetical protein
MAFITVTLFVVCVFVCAATIVGMAYEVHHDPELGDRLVDRWPALVRSAIGRGARGRATDRAGSAAHRGAPAGR